jgi:hypothetical protein
VLSKQKLLLGLPDIDIDIWSHLYFAHPKQQMLENCSLAVLEPLKTPWVDG